MTTEQDFAAAVAAHPGVWRSVELCGDMPVNNAGQLVRRFIQCGWVEHSGERKPGAPGRFRTVDAQALREAAEGIREIPKLERRYASSLLDQEGFGAGWDCTVPLAKLMGYPAHPPHLKGRRHAPR